jgi:hypothetical protein
MPRMIHFTTRHAPKVPQSIATLITSSQNIPPKFHHQSRKTARQLFPLTISSP